MNSSFPTGPFGGGGSGSPFGGPGGPASAIFDAMDQLRKSFEQRTSGPSRMARGDVRSAVIALLAEEPMHGYQIINEIAERSGGSWKPSAGSVYPTLQLLADEGLITAEEQNGRKTYSLTGAGREEAEIAADKPAPWEAFSSREHSHLTALPKAGMDLAGAAAQVARTGSPEQVQEAVTVLDEARRRLYAILAQD
ncbi:PadR family transcriptional regulator [Microbacterium murale]|uniref:DNA-binding PadR family transcriptional regulator n=1 Tax=Microbacterium murale TaxID=1081040 RepID=A0ABU0P921_9MICO|nr:PadR family transcriptional regulator [Microbacterium murale]MDQ0643829.1 DNA-binding PadR family transcriptional regulator [Microbacterium murale]